MKPWIKTYFPVIILLGAIFFLWINRWESLSFPYYWDEMGVYGKGVQYLFANGNGVLPASLPPELSRGHPLLFYFIHALVIDCFGNSFFVSHAFALLLSTATIISVYFLAKILLPKPIAAATACLLLSQNIFIAQSTFVLPEISVTLISTLALLSFLKGRYFHMAVLLCVGVWIKESVILIAAFFGIVYFLRLIFSGKFKKEFNQLLIFTLPLIGFLGFLFIQKIQNGWYFFPYHTSIVEEGAFSGFFDKLDMHYNFIFYKQGRNQWLITAIITLISLPMMKKAKSMLLLIGFFLSNVVIFSLAFYMDRYLLYLYPVLVIIIAQGLYTLSGKRVKLTLLLLLVFCGLSLYQLNNPSFRYDVAIAYEDLLQIHLEAIDELKEIEQDHFTLGSNFPIDMSLDDTRLGYVDEAFNARVSLHPLNQNPDYMLLYKSPAFGNYSPIKEFEQGETKIVLYKRDYEATY